MWLELAKLIFTYILKPALYFLSIFFVINILALTTINNPLFFGWFYSIFGYNYLDIYNLKGWVGIGKIWRAFNREHIFKGYFLDFWENMYRDTGGWIGTDPEEDNDQTSFAAQEKVRAKPAGKSVFYAATVTAANPDGTYNITYEDTNINPEANVKKERLRSIGARYVYSKEEMDDDLNSMQNYALILRIFTTAGFLVWLAAYIGTKISGPSVGVSLAASGTSFIIWATISRLLAVSALADLILYTFFYKPIPEHNYKEDLKTVGDELERIKAAWDVSLKTINDTKIDVSTAKSELKTIRSELKQAVSDKDVGLETIKKGERDTKIQEIKTFNATIKAAATDARTYKKEMEDQRKLQKELIWKILIEAREVKPIVKDYIPNTTPAPIYRYERKIDDISLALSYISAAVIIFFATNLFFNADYKPRLIVLITLLVTLGLVVPVYDIFTARKKDFDDFENKSSILQNWVNRYHPKSIQPDTKVDVKIGYDYDSFYTIQGIIVVSIALLTVLHIFFGFYEWPKRLTRCSPLVPGRNIEHSTIEGMDADYKRQLCIEDARYFRNQGYSPQSFKKRFLGFKPSSYYAKEVAFILIPTIAGIVEGRLSVKESKDAGIKEKWEINDFKNKAFLYGYWKAVVSLLFVTTVFDPEQAKNIFKGVKEFTSNLDMDKVKELVEKK
tara:strand:- start:1453 stop:3474 length:2022 start_codon:yes stop_codon:yes gene_type:complete